ncbi:atherin-like [Motacilla alba alba]|uniref:atherin-like n=1 Tax=Motacilla alba alba TaxID=1094192 RepID=UPI0018D57918|nr:atherin-like [Motacilla alba alba]
MVFCKRKDRERRMSLCNFAEGFQPNEAICTISCQTHNPRDTEAPSGTHGSPGKRRSPARTPCALPRRGTSRPRDKPAPAGAPPAARPPLGEGRAGPRGRELAPSPLPPPAEPAALPPRSPANSRRCPAAVLPPFPRLSQRWESGGTRSGSAVSPSAPPPQRRPAGGAGGAEGAAGTEGTKAAAAAGNKERQDPFTSGNGPLSVTAQLIKLHHPIGRCSAQGGGANHSYLDKNLRFGIPEELASTAFPEEDRAHLHHHWSFR